MCTESWRWANWMVWRRAWHPEWAAQSGSHGLEFIPQGSNTLCPREMVPGAQSLVSSSAPPGLRLWGDPSWAPHHSAFPANSPFPEPGWPSCFSLSSGASWHHSNALVLCPSQSDLVSTLCNQESWWMDMLSDMILPVIPNRTAIIPARYTHTVCVSRCSLYCILLGL